MTNPFYSRNLEQDSNASLQFERAAESVREPQNSEDQAESIIQVIEVVFGVVTLLTCLGFGGWLVLWSVAEVVNHATFHDLIRCFS